MSLDGYIGEPIPLQILYLNDTGAPAAVLSPTVVVFRYGAGGARVTLVEAPLVVVGEGDPGRYTYLYTIPDSIEDGTVLYVEFRATDAVTGFLSVTSEVINARTRGGSLGLNVRFVR